MKKSIKKIQQWKKSRRKQANKQTNKKAKNQKKGGKEVFWLTIEGAKYMHDLPACYEKKNGKSSLLIVRKQS